MAGLVDGVLRVSRGIGAEDLLIFRSYQLFFGSEKNRSISSKVLPSVSGTMIVIKIKLNIRNMHSINI